jgi:hypothetical protein
MSEIQKSDISTKIESVVIGGDLSQLSPAERVEYYKAVCQSVGLNPLTKPFDYMKIQGRLVLYAKKGATDQLRQINDINVIDHQIEYLDEWIKVEVTVKDNTGRTDWDVGVVNKKDMQGNFGNALMKAVTKAKRRATLSICGLGMLDETEVETIPDVEIVEAEVTDPEPKPNGKSWKPEFVEGLIDNNIAEHPKQAVAILNLLMPGSVEDAIKKGKIYRGWRDSGKEVEDAAQLTIEGNVPK